MDSTTRANMKKYEGKKSFFYSAAEGQRCHVTPYVVNVVVVLVLGGGAIAQL